MGKDDPRIAAYGTVDELGAFIGLARLSAEGDAARHPHLAALATILGRVQHELFNLGSILATEADRVRESQPRIRQAEIDRLEREIDEANASLAALRSFVLAGGSLLSVQLHQCRTICRRAERLCVALARAELVDPLALGYLNRLGDAIFVWSRWANQIHGVD